MKNRVVILILALNVAALTAGFLYFNERLNHAPEISYGKSDLKNDPPWKSKTPKLKTIVPKVQKISPAPVTVIYKTNQFHWSQVESADYRKYIENLRAIGCPENTIKDIIMTDVMKLYALRRGQSYHNGRAFKFWETDEKRKLKQSQLEEQEKLLAAIDKELPSVLRELLGINYEREINKYFVDTDEDNHRLAFLPEEKRNRLLALREQFDLRRERLIESFEGRALSPGDLDQLKALDQEKDAALADFLTDDERRNYALCASPVADRLRSELVGFNPTETEFLEIFNRHQAIEDKYAFQDMSDETVRAAKADDEQRAEAEILSMLGETRAADYNRSKNTEYRELTTFSERFDLPPSTYQTLADIRNLAEAEHRRLLADKHLSEQARARALAAVESETQRTLRQTLGEKAFNEYTQTTGQWVRQLEKR